MSGIVYILCFTDSGRYYVGSTSNLERRLKQHRHGHTSTTHRGGDFKLAFSKVVSTLEQARRLERKIKSWKRKDFIGKIVQEQRLRIDDGV